MRPFCFARLAKKQFDMGQSQNGASHLFKNKSWWTTNESEGRHTGVGSVLHDRIVDIRCSRGQM
jgi:hypothetical protein